MRVTETNSSCILHEEIVKSNMNSQNKCINSDKCVLGFICTSLKGELGASDYVGGKLDSKNHKAVLRCV